MNEKVRMGTRRPPIPAMLLGMQQEFARIERLRARLGSGGPGIELGIGDDAAVLSPSHARQVVSVDAAVADVHFRWDFAPAATLMRRAVVASLSDLAAMGARPRGLLSALVLAADVDDARFDGLVEGLRKARDEYAVPVIGGNLSAGAQTSITTTVLGSCTAPPVTRAGAHVGDGIYVTGPLGGSALGLEALLGEHTPHAEPFVARFLEPTARLDLSERLALHASAAIDISDGLLQDLMHLCRASGIQAELQLDAIPRAAGLSEGARALGLEADALCLNGGEEYELVFTSAQPDRAAAFATRIGTVQTGEPAIYGISGTTRTRLEGAGFDHFRPPRTR